MRLLNQERRIIIVLNCNFVSCSEATISSEVVNTAEAFNTVPTVCVVFLKWVIYDNISSQEHGQAFLTLNSPLENQ